MSDQTFHFQPADYVIFALTVLVSLGIGVYHACSGGRQRTTSEYLLGGRKMPFLPVALSLFVSYQSSIMMLGMPAEGYMYGLQVGLGFIPLALTQLLCAWITVPLLHPLNITSAFEYLELRFKSRLVRLLGSGLGIIYDLWYMGVVLFGPAVALQAVRLFIQELKYFGYFHSDQLSSVGSIVGLSMLSVIYTSIGGLKAVIWTDVFQTFIMFSGIIAVLIKGTITVGGPKPVWDIANKGGRIFFFDFSLDPRVRHTFWNLILSDIAHGLFSAFRQGTVQRVCSTSCMKTAKRVVLLNAPLTTLIYSLSLYEGIVAYAYYTKKECDPFVSGQLENQNQIIPRIVVDIFHTLTGMPGLFVAALFSAALSTLSSALSSLSALLWSDFVHPLVGDIPEWKATLVAKTSVIIFGIIASVLAWLISFAGGPLMQVSMSVKSSISGPLFVLFFLGAFCPRTTAKGALIGGLVGMSLSMWLAMGINFSPALRKSPKLPPAPTAGCPLLSNTTFSVPCPDGMTVYGNGSTCGTGPSFNETWMSESAGRKPEGIEHFYTLSYRWLNPIGILTTLTVAYIASIITGPNKPGDVNPKYLLAVSDSLLIWLPKPVRRYISSKGTQFINIDYPEKFSNTETHEMEGSPFVQHTEA